MESKKGNSRKRVVFSEATYQKINTILSDFIKRSQAMLCIFADVNGYPVSHSGRTRKIDVNALAALAAGSFSANAAMAKLTCGTDRFKYVLHEGKTNIFLCDVTQDYVLIILFDNRVALGMIRLLTQQIVKSLLGLITELKRGGEKASQFLDTEFQELLGRKVSRSLGVKK